MGNCEVEKNNKREPNNTDNFNKNNTISVLNQSNLPNLNQISPPIENNNIWDNRSGHLQVNNQRFNQVYRPQNPLTLNQNITPEPPNPLLTAPQVNQMENTINKLKQQNEDIKVTLEVNKKLLDEQTNAKIKLQKDLLTNSQNLEALSLQKDKMNERINLLVIENNQLKLNINKTQIELEQKTQALNALQIKYDEIAPILVGLDNIGATCYMNATLQSLSNVPQLTNFFLHKFSPNDPKKRMSNEYYQVIKCLWSKEYNGKSYAPHSFKNVLSQMNPLFQGVAANDSKDLINFLIETLHSELNMPKNKNTTNNIIDPSIQLDEVKMFNIFLSNMVSEFNSPISDLFYGVLETQSKCINCQRIKYNFQIYSFIEFPLEQVYNYCISTTPGGSYISNGIPSIDIYKCFEHYHQLTPMVGDNKIYCNECRNEYDAFYGTCLYSLPRYLIINLNRGKNAVFKCNVKFPELLKLTNYVRYTEGKTIFQLNSVICHYGESNMGGHFIAYCRHYKNNSWYIYNDSTVQKCSSNKDYLHGMPYILFYKALDDDDY